MLLGSGPLLMPYAFEHAGKYYSIQNPVRSNHFF